MDYEDEGMGLKVFEIRVTLLHVTCTLHITGWNKLWNKLLFYVLLQALSQDLNDTYLPWTTREANTEDTSNVG